MASMMLSRFVVAASRRSLLPKVSPCVKHYSDKYPPYYDPEEGKEASKTITMADELGGAVGLERWELLQRVKGVEDPFQLNAKTVTPGTKEKPTIVPTLADNRVVGCVCEEDAVVIRWMRLYSGEQRRCQCGHWFKLVPVDD